MSNPTRTRLIPTLNMVARFAPVNGSCADMPVPAAALVVVDAVMMSEGTAVDDGFVVPWLVPAGADAGAPLLPGLWTFDEVAAAGPGPAALTALTRNEYLAPGFLRLPNRQALGPGPRETQEYFPL